MKELIESDPFRAFVQLRILAPLVENYRQELAKKLSPTNSRYREEFEKLTGESIDEYASMFELASSATAEFRKTFGTNR